MAVDPLVERAGRLPAEAAGARLHNLFAEHGRMVYGVCRLLLRDPHDAEDAAQQTFLSAHQSLIGGTRPHDPAAWLAAIARNECGSRARARMREPLPLDLEVEPAAETTEQLAAQREEVEVLREAMLGLPRKQREAVLLREFYGLRYDEVGAALGVSRPAVESLLFRARTRLRAELRPFRLASGGLALPAALREAISEAVPGFAAAGAGAGGLGAVAFLSKAAAAPIAVKIAAAALAVGAAGTSLGIVGSRQSEQAQARPVSAQVAVGASAPILEDAPAVEELDLAPSDVGPPSGPGDEARPGRSSKVKVTAEDSDDHRGGGTSGKTPSSSGGALEPADPSEPAVSSPAPADDDHVDDEEHGEGGGPGPDGSVEPGEDRSGSSGSSSGEDSGETDDVESASSGEGWSGDGGSSSGEGSGETDDVESTSSGEGSGSTDEEEDKSGPG